MPLPKSIRSRVPVRVRDDPRLRALALGSGLISPRPMHSAGEAATLARLAAGAKVVVELGVYEGSSALMFVDALGPETALHLIDPFIDASGWALRSGAQASPTATRLAVKRAARRHHGPRITWHVARSQDVGRAWIGGQVDLVFVDGDHSPEGCRQDWEQWHPHVRAGGAIAFHDARAGQPNGSGSPGPTQVVDELFRGSQGSANGWRISEELDTLVVVTRDED